MATVSPRKAKAPNILGDWDDVRFFLAVAKTGSFSAAANQLNTKQTTVGRRIQALERRLGAKLFDRHRHGMEVTPAARGVLVQAESMLSHATSIERHLAGHPVANPPPAPGGPRHPLLPSDLQPAGGGEGRPVQHVDLRGAQLHRAVR